MIIKGAFILGEVKQQFFIIRKCECVCVRIKNLNCVCFRVKNTFKGGPIKIIRNTILAFLDPLSF